jgi:hypothetical protein
MFDKKKAMADIIARHYAEFPKVSHWRNRANNRRR